MKLPRFGYACINTTLAAEGVHVNRSMMKKTFLSRGTGYASELALKNVSDLSTIIDWNISRDIKLYRMSSDMFPWMSEYEIEDLPDFALISKTLAGIGEKARGNGHRFTFHPGPFNVLASLNHSVVEKTIKELRQHGEIMDLLGLPRSPFSKINIHIGGAYGDKPSAIKRFIKNVAVLPDTARLRLTIENDDKANMFSVNDLLLVHEATGVPVVFDFLHHQFCTGDLTSEEAFLLATSTWPRNVRPIVHFSSSKKVHEDPLALPTAHAEHIYERIHLFGESADIMFEAKGKEMSLLRYRNAFGMGSPVVSGGS